MKLRKPEEHELRITTIVIIFFITMLMLAHKCTAQEELGGKEKIYICHRTKSESNPYNLIYVDTSSNTAHNDHDHDIFGIGDENMDGCINEEDCEYLVYVPVDLILFEAIEQKNGMVVIRWSTATESNSAYFILESSEDGLNWTQETVKTAAGNSSVLTNYVHVIPYLYDPFTYFRLIQVDMDDKVKVYDKIMTKNSSIKTVKQNPDSVGYDIIGRQTKDHRIKK